MDLVCYNLDVSGGCLFWFCHVVHWTGYAALWQCPAVCVWVCTCRGVCVCSGELASRLEANNSRGAMQPQRSTVCQQPQCLFFFLGSYLTVENKLRLSESKAATSLKQNATTPSHFPLGFPLTQSDFSWICHVQTVLHTDVHWFWISRWVPTFLMLLDLGRERKTLHWRGNEEMKQDYFHSSCLLFLKKLNNYRPNVCHRIA